MKAAFFDVDGTLTQTRVWRGIMDYFKLHGLRRFTNAAFWGYHAPLFLLHRMGLLSQAGYRAPWAAHLPWYFRGFSVKAAQAIWEWTVGDYLEQHWRRNVRAVLDGHRERGDVIVLVSGGPQPLIERIGREVGAGHAVGTVPEVEGDVYTGGVVGPACIDAHKPRRTKAYLERSGVEVDFQTSSAYADSTSDVPLLEMVGNPVATHPDDRLRAIAEKRGWRILEG